MLEIQDKNIKYEDKTEQVFKSIFSSVKNYAEQYETLFVAIVTIGSSIISTIINLCFYFYKVGYCSYFGIDESIILSGIKENSLLLIGYYLASYSLIILVNILAYIFYANRKFLWFCLPWSSLVAIWNFIYIVKNIGFGGFGKNVFFLIGGVIIVAIAIFINTAMIIMLLFLPVLGYLWMFPSRKIELNRYEIKLEQLAKQGSRKEVLEYQIKHREILEYKTGNSKKASNKKSFLLKICATIFGVFFAFYYLKFVGYISASTNKTMNIINENSKISLSEKITQIDSYAVIYEADDFLIISPSNEENGELHIFKNYQIKVERNNLMLMKQTYKKIVMENTVLLTSASA